MGNKLRHEGDEVRIKVIWPDIYNPTLGVQLGFLIVGITKTCAGKIVKVVMTRDSPASHVGFPGGNCWNSGRYSWPWK